MKISISDLQEYVRANSRNVAWFVAGIVVSIAVVASADFAGPSGQTTSAPCDLSNAASDALNRRVGMIGQTTLDPGKYFNPSSPDSCLGDLSVANVDLSRLIPDPMSLLGDAATKAFDQIKSAAEKKICAAARNSVGDIIGTYNSAINMANGAPQNVIDAGIGQASRQVLDSRAMTWNVPTGSTKDVLNGVTGWGNGALGAGASTKGTVPLSNVISQPSAAPTPIVPSTGGSIFAR